MVSTDKSYTEFGVLFGILDAAVDSFSKRIFESEGADESQFENIIVQCIFNSFLCSFV
jgi:hypothetical protein